MNQDPVADPADRPMMPPEPDSGMGALRWVITGIALVLLVVGAWRGYTWFIDDVAKRRAVAEGAAPALQALACHHHVAPVQRHLRHPVAQAREFAVGGHGGAAQQAGAGRAAVRAAGTGQQLGGLRAVGGREGGGQVGAEVLGQFHGLSGAKLRKNMMCQ